MSYAARIDSHGRTHQERVATLIEIIGVMLFKAFEIKVPGVVYIVRLQKMLRKRLGGEDRLVD